MKKFLILTHLSVLLLFLLSGCNKPEPELEEPLYHSVVARNYLSEILNIMQDNAINRYIIDWSIFRSEVLVETNGAETIEDTYPGIERALELLEDNHSVFIKPDGSGFTAGSFQCDLQNITETSWPENIGYIKVNSFSGSANSSEAISFAKEIQQQIRGQDNSELEGWIVDLRGNLGGNMWPMLAGIGPILGEGVAGYFIDPDNNQSSWGFMDGSAMSNGVEAVTQIVNSYELLNQNPKVAVLLNNSIASSGEALAVSFIGRENTRSFGTSTCGLSTSNSYFPLSDGAVLNLTTAYFADRNKRIYGESIEPDVQSENDDIIQTSVYWILN